MSKHSNWEIHDGKMPFVVYGLGMSFMTPRRYIEDETPRPRGIGGSKGQRFSFFRYNWSSSIRMFSNSSVYGWSQMAEHLPDQKMYDIVIADVDRENIQSHVFKKPSVPVTPQVLYYDDSKGPLGSFLKKNLVELFDSEILDIIKDRGPSELDNILAYHGYAILLVMDLSKLSLKKLEYMGRDVAIYKSEGVLKPSLIHSIMRKQPYNSIIYVLQSPATVERILKSDVLPKKHCKPREGLNEMLRITYLQRAAIRRYFEKLLLLDSLVYIQDTCRKVSTQLSESGAKQDLETVLQISTDSREISGAQFLLDNYLSFCKDNITTEPAFVDTLTSFSRMKELNKEARINLNILQKDIDRTIMVSNIITQQKLQQQNAAREYQFNQIQILVGFMVAFEILATILSRLLSRLSIPLFAEIPIWLVLVFLLGLVGWSIYSKASRR